MNDVSAKSYTAFDGHRSIVSGSLQAVALVVKRAVEARAIGPVLIFDDTTGQSIDINIRGSEEEVLARLAPPVVASFPPAAGGADPDGANALGDEPRGRGRPKLGVTAREVTLLPRHWEWLAAQPGGASVTLRKLVDAARRTNDGRDRVRAAQERAYYFMSGMAGDMSGFEEATRALFASDRRKLSDLIATWPEDVRNHVIRLAYGDDDQVSTQKNDQGNPSKE